eukprot:998850-Pleurochrysis_carterae.AAC.2
MMPTLFNSSSDQSHKHGRTSITLSRTLRSHQLPPAHKARTEELSDESERALIAAQQSHQSDAACAHRSADARRKWRLLDHLCHSAVHASAILGVGGSDAEWQRMLPFSRLAGLQPKRFITMRTFLWPWELWACLIGEDAFQRAIPLLEALEKPLAGTGILNVGLAVELQVALQKHWSSVSIKDLGLVLDPLRIFNAIECAAKIET